MSKKTQQARRRIQRKRLSGRAVSIAAEKSSGGPSDFRRWIQAISQKDLLDLYLAREYDDLSETLLCILREFANHLFFDIDRVMQAKIDELVGCLLYLFTKPDYVISKRFQEHLVWYLPIITNLVAISSFKTTDPQVEILNGQPNSLPKMLALYSARNRIRIDRDWLFDQDPKLAAIWYGRFFHATTSSRTQIVYENLRHHLQPIDERHELASGLATDAVFYVTYVDARMERTVKERMNAAIRRKLRYVTISNKPDPRSIAIVTGSWRPTASIYRALRPFVEAIADRYDVTLVHLGKDRKDTDTRLFSDVKRAAVDTDAELTADFLTGNNFKMLFYPQVGLCTESRYLSNLRIAPIQVTCYGHPTSTWGSEIDYYIGGTELEVLPGAEKNYWERLVLIPGGAVYPTIPDYQPTGPERPDSQVIINCVWNTGKCNWPMLMVLKKILGRAGKKVVFQFLPSLDSLQMNGFVPYEKDIEVEIGAENIRVLATQFDKYMQALETGHFSIDSYPFGSFTGVIDALHVGLPMVTWEGDRCYNMSASRLMRKVGLEELVATNEDEYIAKICRLIDDGEYRNELSDRIRQLDLKQRLFDPKEVDYFVKAIEYLMSNHEALKRDTSREPILISS